MKKRTAYFRVTTTTIALLVALSQMVMAATPAGTQIRATGSATYYSSASQLMPAATSNTVTTTVGEAAAVSLSPTSSSKSATPGTSVDFPITVINTGNASGTFNFSSSAPNGSSVKIIKDDNRDGIRQSTETSVETATDLLNPSGVCNCFLNVTLPSGTASDTITLTAASAADSTKSARGTFTVQDSTQISSAYILSWLLNGYYANTNNSTRLSTDYLSGESNVVPAEGSTSGGKTWGKYDSAAERIDLSAVFGNPSYCAGYAHSYVYSPTAQTVNLWVGSDNGIKVWLNGTAVWTNDSTRGYTVDQDKRTVNLAAGWNRMLVKISQYGGNWCFSAKICDSTGKAITGIKYATAPPAASDTTAPVISNVQNTSLGTTSATVEWDTNEPSTSMVEYGTTSAYGQNIEDARMVTHHSVTINNLTTNTTYNLRVGSSDAAGNEAWNGNYTLTTKAGTTAGDGYIKSWILNGFYANTNNATRLSTDYLGGEANVIPAPGDSTAGKVWNRYDSPTERVDLAVLYGNPTYCAGYAHAYIYSPSAQTVNMWDGSDNGIKVWLNGTAVWTNDSTRGYLVDQDKRTINLAAGWNRMLVKISQYGGNWCFSTRICDSTGKAIPGIEFSVTPPAAAEPPVTEPPISEPPTTQPPTGMDSPYVKSWLLNGYYTDLSKATRMATDYLGGEANVQPAEGMTSGIAQWFKMDYATGLIDLATPMGNPMYCAAYAHTYIYSDTARTVNLRMGSDDGIKVWLNGQLVWNNDTYRGCVEDQDRTTVNLAAGWNRMLVKVSQNQYSWKFILKLCDANGNVVPGITYSATP